MLFLVLLLPIAQAAVCPEAEGQNLSFSDQFIVCEGVKPAQPIIVEDEPVMENQAPRPLVIPEPVADEPDEGTEESRSLALPLILGGFGLLVFFSYLNRHRKAEAIRNYIHTCREQGYTDQQIRAVLQRDRGFKEKYINKQFAALET